MGKVGIGDPVFRIGEVSRRTGLSRATIRTWEQRYGIVEPGRSIGGQRLYREQDIDRFRAVREIRSQGWTLSAAAEQVTHFEASPSGLVETSAAPNGAATDSGPDDHRSSVAGVVDVEALTAVHEATRAMLHAANAREISAALVDAVERLGAEVGPAELDGAEVLPVDLSLGEGDPLLPCAEPFSVARMRLESLLPALVEDARRMLTLLR